MPDDAPTLALDPEFVAEVRRLGIDVAQAAQDGLVDAVSKARGEEWKRENRAALESYNDWIAKNGLPLERYRRF